ncbi:MAG TPA: OsmC family peroxiredoxin [Bacteroidota bacterium]|nr:OsmC family peroxiredoxin [Bacteroidota bacterium]
MKISARVENIRSTLRVSLDTNGVEHTLAIPPGSSGLGSSMNGGELLFLAMATCYCNDIYREAARNINYRAKVSGPASQEALQNLMLATDRVAEIQNSIRAAIPVTLNKIEAVHEPS